jgi:ferredoxin
MERRLVVWVDHGACVGNGTCLTIAPRVFVHNADRQSEVANPGGDSAPTILRAAENCPVRAIHVEDAESGERLFP